MTERIPSGDSMSQVSAASGSVLQVELRAGADQVWRACELSHGAGGLHLARSGGEFDLKDEVLAGVDYGDGVLTLHPSAGGIVQFRGSPELADVAEQIVRRVCSLREFTRPLRGFGTRRGRPGEEHDAWFAPLIAARHKAEGERTPEGRLAAIDGVALARSFESIIANFATARYPNDAPERRALQETMRELAEPLFSALASLGRSADSVRNAEVTVHLVRWREWLEAVEQVFASADRSWLGILAILGDATRQNRNA